VAAGNQPRPPLIGQDLFDHLNKLYNSVNIRRCKHKHIEISKNIVVTIILLDLSM